MNTTPLNPLLEDYLARVDAEARYFPDQNRQELLERLRTLFEMRLTEASSDADVRYLLQAIGPPIEVVAGATLTLDLGVGDTQPLDSLVVDYTQPLHPLVEDWFARLDAEARVLPDEQRQELLTMLREYLAAGLIDTKSDADVRNLLEFAGSPSDIVAEMRALEVGPTQPATSQVPPAPSPPAPLGKVEPWGKVEIFAVLGLTAGAVLIPVVGPVIGLFFVWASTQWTSREKVVAAAVGLFPALVLVVGAVLALSSGGEAAVGVGPVELFVLMLAMLGPLLAGGYLALRLSQRRREGR